jgi:hypothetical protein
LRYRNFGHGNTGKGNESLWLVSVVEYLGMRVSVVLREMIMIVVAVVDAIDTQEQGGFSTGKLRLS